MSTQTQENLNHILKKTPLFSCHKNSNAKIIPFAGWEMPVQYESGVRAEHQAVRTAVGIFDVSHMGEIEVSGLDSTKFLQAITLNDVSKISVGQAQYNAFCNEHGKMLDDIIIYKRDEKKYFICVNAGNIEKDYNWIKTHAANYDVHVQNLSDSYAQIAVQGPQSRKILGELFGEQIQSLKYYHFLESKIFDQDCLVARTGYTGELGYEIYCPAEVGGKIWNQLLEVGKKYNLLPCGLAARDILRLEAGYLLYGNDMDENTTALECGLKWITKFEKDNFIGKDALLEQEKNGLAKRLVGFEMCDRAIGRQGYKVFHPEQRDKEIGIVTSGSPSPSLSKNIGFMYVEKEFSKLGTNVLIDIRGSLKPAQVVKKSFYTSGTVHS